MDAERDLSDEPLSDEANRLLSVEFYGQPQAHADQDFDNIVSRAAEVLDVPMASIALIGEKQLRFRASTGLVPLSGPIDLAVKPLTIQRLRPVIVTDVSYLMDWPKEILPEGSQPIRFYAGVPIVNAERSAIGAFCIYDVKSRWMSRAQIQLMWFFAELALERLELERLEHRREHSYNETQRRFSPGGRPFDLDNCLQRLRQVILTGIDPARAGRLHSGHTLAG